MRRRFRLSRRSAEVGVGRVAATVERLQQHLMGRDVYLSSRGYVSTDSHGWRRHVGFVGGVAAAEAGGHWVVEVETTEEYEARQHEVVGGVATGRQDLDAVEEIRRQLEVAATVAHAEITRGFNASVIHDQTAQAMRPNNLFQNEVLTYSAASNQIIQPGQIVYATSNGSVSATPSRHSPVVGTFVRMEGDNAVVALHDGGGVVTTSSYTANIPITIHGDLDDLAASMQRQSRELAAVARRRQDEAAEQTLTTSRPVCFPIAGPITDERTRRISEIVEHVSREAAQRYLGEPIQVDPHTTHITESERRRIEEGVTTALPQRLDGDIRFVVDREMRAGQLQTHIVGSTTGERGFTSSFDSGDVWSRTESRRSSLRGHSADLLVVDDLLEETTPERQEQVEQLYAELARLRPGSVVVAAPATGTVRLTNTSSEAYTIAPGALAVSSSPDAPTTWYNVDETTLSPGGVVEVPVRSTSSEALPSQITHVRSPLPGGVVSPTTITPRTYTVDAVEVSPDPICAPWLPRLLPWLGSAVAADDAELRRLDDEVAATGQLVLVYVAERRALRVERLAVDGNGVAWSTIRDRSAVLS